MFVCASRGLALAKGYPQPSVLLLPINQSIHPVKFLAREQPHEFNWDEFAIEPDCSKKSAEICVTCRGVARQSADGPADNYELSAISDMLDAEGAVTASVTPSL